MKPNTFDSANSANDGLLYINEKSSISCKIVDESIEFKLFFQLLFC